MDTSETYIKMCEKAGEIQEQARVDGVEYGDYIYVLANNDYAWYTGQVELVRGERGYKYAPLGVIFIPRQDQLQEMLGFNGLRIATLNFIVVFAINDPAVKEDWSIEQITLATVMFKCYNKVWDGEGWIADKVLESKTMGEK